MNRLLLLVAFFNITVAHLYASPLCMGYTQNDPETGVGKGGQLRMIGCGCECHKFERTSDNRCINCLHHQAGTGNRYMVDITDENNPIVGQEPGESAPEPA